MGEAPLDTPKKAYLYFANLDGLRAIAAFMVVVSHIEYHKREFGFDRFEALHLRNFGKIGVTIFFALSGFLITYLLLQEKKNFGKIGFKDFYIRRILRIWPLYFLIITVGFFIYPKHSSANGFWLSLFFMPNLAFALAWLPSLFDPIWSIGTEEQFYIFHPHLFRFKKLEHSLRLLIAITAGFVVLSIVVHHYQYSGWFLQEFSQFLYFARFDDMLIGAIVAVLYYNSKQGVFSYKLQPAFNLLFKKYSQALLCAILVVFIYFFLRSEIPQGDLVIAALASLLIANLCEPGSVINLNYKPLTYCGKISYGMYLMHKYPLFLMFYLVNRYLAGSGIFLQNIVLYAGTFVLVILLSSVSYFGYERYFLRRKSRFQKITATRTHAGEPVQP